MSKNRYFYLLTCKMCHTVDHSNSWNSQRFVTIILASSSGNTSPRIYGQLRPWSDCAFAQSDQVLRCPFLGFQGTVEHIKNSKSPYDTKHLASDRRHTFAWHVPRIPTTKTQTSSKPAKAKKDINRRISSPGQISSTQYKDLKVLNNL